MKFYIPKKKKNLSQKHVVDEKGTTLDELFVAGDPSVELELVGRRGHVGRSDLLHLFRAQVFLKLGVGIKDLCKVADGHDGCDGLLIDVSRLIRFFLR